MDNNLDAQHSVTSEPIPSEKIIQFVSQHHTIENGTSKPEGNNEKSDLEQEGTCNMFLCEDGGNSADKEYQFVVAEELIVSEQERVSATPGSNFVEVKTGVGEVLTVDPSVGVVSEPVTEVVEGQSSQSQSVVYMPVNFVSEEDIGMSGPGESVLVIHGEDQSAHIPTALTNNLTDAEMTSIHIVMDAAGQVISANQNVSSCQVTASSSTGTGPSHSDPKAVCIGGQAKSFGDSRSPPILFQVLTEDGVLHNINLDPVNVTTAAEESTNSLDSARSKEDLIMEQNTDKPFQCDLCSATFSRLGNYTRHRMIHTIHMKEDYRYKCEECGRVFLQRCDLNRHMDIHTGTFPYTCRSCGKGYIRHSDLVVHERFHNKDRSFKCAQCPKAFYQSGDLRRHVRQVHEQVKPLTCGHCQRKFSKEATLIRHMQTVHRDIILTSLSNKFPLPIEVQEELSVSSSTKTLTLEKSSEAR